MKKNTKIVIWAVVAIIVIILAGWGIRSWNNRNSVTPESAIANATSSVSSFTVERPDLVVRGTNLARAEIYAVPARANLSESDIVLLGDASLKSTDANGQTWTLPIPATSAVYSDIYVIGYGINSQVAGSMSLGLAGQGAITNALWGNGKIATSTPVSPTANQYKTLGISQSAIWSGLQVTLLTIDSDSRCAEGVQCIQAGNVTGTVSLTLNGASATQKFDSSKPLVYQGYTISVDSVTPAPAQGNRDYSKYKVTFRIQES